MNAKPHIEIRILSQSQYLCVLRAAVSEALRQLGMDEQETIKVITAVDEAATNVMRHAYKGEQDRPIHIKLWPIDHAGRRGVEIVVEDEAENVDLSQIKGRSLDEIRPGGLGVHIIREVMDEVEYATRPDGTGVRLTMRKYTQPAKTAKTG